MPQCLPPVVPPRPRSLVLGSMPGGASLRAQQYYAHPRNQFWPMMALHLGIDAGAPYEARLHALGARGVALWDVLAVCERKGSLDGAIRRVSEVPNAVAHLLARHDTINAVLLNGRLAHNSFQRHLESACREVRPELQIHALPSTSPANQSIPIVERRRAWAVVAQHVWPRGGSLRR